MKGWFVNDEGRLLLAVLPSLRISFVTFCKAPELVCISISIYPQITDVLAGTRKSLSCSGMLRTGLPWIVGTERGESARGAWQASTVYQVIGNGLLSETEPEGSGRLLGLSERRIRMLA